MKNSQYNRNVFGKFVVCVVLLFINGCSSRESKQGAVKNHARPSALPAYWWHPGLENWIRQTTEPVVVPELKKTE